MNAYSPRWRTTIIAAIVLHVAAAFAFVYVSPKLAPAPTLVDVATLEVVDVDLTDDAAQIVADAAAVPADAPPDVKPTFDATALVLPELQSPAPNVEPALAPQVKPLERTPTPKPADNRQVVTRPPITINAVYPEKGSGLGFKGYVSFAAHLSKEGKVTSTEILQSSGRYFVDEIARKAAEQWTFKPALDQHGRPMECDKIITFDFKKFS